MLGKGRSIGHLLVLILSCAIIGSFIGEVLKPYLPALLVHSYNVGVGPFPINLKVLCITFGFTIDLNIMSIIGIAVALVIFMKH